jgi:acetyltransferase
LLESRHTVTVRNLEALFKPHSIALIGAAREPRSPGAIAAANLFSGAFDGPVLPVNAGYLAIHGALTWPSVEALPLDPDLAVIARPAAEVPGILAALGRRRTRVAVILSTDADADGVDAGRVLRQRMVEAAAPSGLRLIGPACLGFVAPKARINASYAHTGAAEGDLAFVTQSGTVASAVLDWARSRNVGFSLVASLGDMIDVDFDDLLDYLAHDTATRAILVCAERIGRARRFLSAARAASRLKPLIVLKMGGAAHRSGPPAGPDDGRPAADPEAIYAAAFARAGCLGVADGGDLLAAAETLSRRPKIIGDRLAILTNGRGAGVMALDLLHAHGGRPAALSDETIEALDALLPAGWGRGNPVNVYADAPPDRMRLAFEALVADQGVDAVLVLYTPTALSDSLETARAVATVGKRTGKPLFTAWMDEADRDACRDVFADGRIAFLDQAEDAITAFRDLVAYERNQAMLIQTPPSVPEQFARDRDAAVALMDAALDAGRTVVDGADAARLLAAYGLATLDERPASGAHSVPLRLAIALDPAFGPVLKFGYGGGVPPALAHPAIALPPLNLTLARHLIADSGVPASLDGEDGRPAVDLDELALAIVKVAQMAGELDSLAGLAIDPLYAGTDGVVAGACRVWVERCDLPAAKRLAIKPYPVELEKTIATRGGRDLLLRPIRPEDAPALQAFVRRMSPADIRMRFFSQIRELDDPFAARLTQLDYDREIALIAVDPAQSSTDIWGVVRVYADADRNEAEYAVTVRSDLKGHGLGRRLMEEIIAYCHQRGIGEIWGQVLAANDAMLGLVRLLGFTVGTDPDDRQLMRVRLALRPPS